MALTLSLALIAVAPDAHAYCRTTTCDPDGPLCEPMEGEPCGEPLFWGRPCVGFALQRDASTQIDYETARQVTYDSIATWMAADCGWGEFPSIRLIDMGPVACNRAEYNRAAGNVNLIVFYDERWPHPSSQQIALTTVTFQVATGEIFDVDIEVNTDDHELSVGETEGYDFQSVMVHELGHFFGLAHSAVEGATMQSEYTPTLRDLEADDMAGICAIYPQNVALPLESDPACNPIPRNGFSPLCAADQVPPTCSAAQGRAPSTPATAASAASALLIAAALLLRRARR